MSPSRIGANRPGSHGTAAAPEPPFDLDHLHRQTFSDRRLEFEVLALFREHSAAALSLLVAARHARARRTAAHTLKGAALAVGAWEVAHWAAAAERSAAEPAAAAHSARQLALALHRAWRFIETERR